MAKVEFDIGIDSVRGILMGSDPYYIRRYPDKNGSVMHIVQARPTTEPHRLRGALRRPTPRGVHAAQMERPTGNTL